MDGVSAMGFNLKLGSNGGVWENDSMKELNLMGHYDKMVLLIFTISFILSISGMLGLVMYGIDILDSAMLITVPFFILGLVWYHHTKKWSMLFIILALSVALYLYLHGFEFSQDFYKENDFVLIFAIDFIFIGAVGVVAFVSALQRLIFYRVVTRVQSMNIKDRMSFEDKVIAFFFNIPNDLDTRDLTMDYNLKRASR